MQTVFTLIAAYTSDRGCSTPQIPPVRVFGSESGALDYLALFAKNRILGAFQDCLRDTLEQSEEYDNGNLYDEDGLNEAFNAYIADHSNQHIIDMLVEYESGEFDYNLSEHPTCSLTEMLEDADIVEINNMKFPHFYVKLSHEEGGGLSVQGTSSSIDISLSPLEEASWSNDKQCWVVVEEGKTYYVQAYKLSH